MGNRRIKFRLTIGFKMISIVSLILALSLIGMTILATYFFRSDNEVRVKEITLDRAELISMKVKSDFNSLIEKSKMIAASLSKTDYNNSTKPVVIENIKKNNKKSDVKNSKKKSDAPEETSSDKNKKIADSFFAVESDIIFIGIVEKASDDSLKIIKNIENTDFIIKNSIGNINYNDIIQAEKENYKKNFDTEFTVHNASVFFDIPVIVIRAPFVMVDDITASSILVIYLSMNRFQEAVKSPSIYKSFIVNGDGDLIAHYDSSLVKAKANFLKLPIVTMMLKSSVDNGQTRYQSENGDFYLGSFKKTGFSDVGVVTIADEAKAYAAVYAVQRRNILITVIILNLAILVIFFFGKSLTKPISKLVEASKQIKEGKFEIDLKPSSNDEIGELTKSFVEMGQGLAEREKLKETFGKFVNKEIAEQVIKGTIKLGGERKYAAVFFSDIRSFTEISEKLEPEEVVEFLNQYMTRMVNCVNITKGVVDKYIGDAIMAVWGAPISHGNDVENAVNGALMMRKELIIFNKGRGGDKRPVIKIGCGINCGPLLAGQIGSDERMEYTVIGDTVNLASRIESLNKPFGTDVLISEEAYQKTKGIFVVEPMQKITVKGKSEPQQIYAVIARKDDPDAPKSLDEVRKMLGITVTGKPSAPVEDEVKYKLVDEKKSAPVEAKAAPENVEPAPVVRKRVVKQAVDESVSEKPKITIKKK